MHRALERGAARRLAAHRGFRTRSRPREALHAARPFRPQGLDAARLGRGRPAAAVRQLADAGAVGAAVPRGDQRGAARDDPRRHGPRAGGVRAQRPLRRGSRLRHARDPHGARLPARELPLAAHEPARGRLWRQHREPPALPARSPRRRARGLAGQAALRAPLLERLGQGRPDGGRAASPSRAR